MMLEKKEGGANLLRRKDPRMRGSKANWTKKTHVRM